MDDTADFESEKKRQLNFFVGLTVSFIDFLDSSDVSVSTFSFCNVLTDIPLTTVFIFSFFMRLKKRGGIFEMVMGPDI